MSDLYAPPTDDELYAPPSKAEQEPQEDPSLFAPPSDLELYAPPPGEARTPVQKEEEDRSFFHKPALGAEYTKDKEIEEIARRQGVDPAELRRLAPYFGARMEGSSPLGEDELKRAAGTIGQSLGLNVPQKIYKKTQTPEMEKALDEVQGLAGGRQSWLQLIGDVAAPVGPAARAGETIGKAALKGAALGATGAAAGAKQGQELQAAGTGAVLGGALGGVANRLASRAETGVEKAVASDLVRHSAPDMEKGIDEVLATKAGSARDVEAHVLGAGADLEPEIAEVIAKEGYSPEFLEKALDHGTEEGQLLLRRATETMPEVVRDLGEGKAVQRLLAQDAIDKESEEFAQYLSGKAVRGGDEARGVIAEAGKAQGGTQALQDSYRTFQREKAGEQFVTDTHLRAGLDNNAKNKALNTISDAQFVLRDIDNKTGLGVEPVHRELNRQVNRMSYPRQDFRKDLDTLYRQAKTTGVDKVVTDSDKIYNALDTGDFSGLSKEEIDTAKGFQNYFRKGLDFVNGVVAEGKGDQSLTPLSIPRRENYVPYQIKPIRELESIIEDKMGDLPVSQATDRGSFISLMQQSPELREVADGLGRLDSKGEASTGPELLARVHDLFATREGRNALETQAKAALERKDSPLPDWMREKNLYKLADSWSSNTLKHLYLRKPVEQLASKARLLKRAGAEVESTYVQNLLSDLQGLRQGTMAAYTSSIGDKYARAIDKLVGPSAGPDARASSAVLKSIPAILSDMNKQIYPNMLGLSPRAILMNATQPIAKTLPEIGMTPYGASALARGAAHAVLNFSRQNEKTVVQGLAPAEFVGKYRRAVADGIRRSSLYALPMESLNKLADMSLYLYSKMDGLNRSITLSTAEVIASDLARGSKGAQASMRKLPTSVQRQVAAAGSEQEVSEILASHLNASTQYNYNKASMSEFGRVMGPFFSTFTKWPTATAGEILAEYRQRGMTRGTLRAAEKFLAPLLLFTAVDKLIKVGAGDKEGEFTPREQRLLGKGGLAGSSPIGSLQSIAKGDFFTPPAVDSILKGVLEPAQKGDASALRRGLINGMQTFTPGSVYVRFLTDDLVTFLTGEKPEGSDFVERTKAGAKVLNRLGRK